MRVQDPLQPALEGLRGRVERAAFLVLVAPDRNVARDLVEHAPQARLVELAPR